MFRDDTMLPHDSFMNLNDRSHVVNIEFEMLMIIAGWSFTVLIFCPALEEGDWTETNQSTPAFTKSKRYVKSEIHWEIHDLWTSRINGCQWLWVVQNASIQLLNPSCLRSLYSFGTVQSGWSSPSRKLSLWLNMTKCVRCPWKKYEKPMDNYRSKILFPMLGLCLAGICWLELQGHG